MMHQVSLMIEMCCGNEEGLYLRLMDSCITHLKAQETSRTCNESKEEDEDDDRRGVSVALSES